MRRLVFFVLSVLITAMPAVSQLAADAPGSASCPQADSAGAVSNTGSSCELAPGTTLGTFTTGKQPLGIAVDSGGNVLVANHTAETVEKLYPTGSVLWTTAVKGTEAIVVDEYDNVWTANYQSNVVTKLSPSGSVLGAYTVTSRGSGYGACGFAFDPSGNLWMTITNYPSADSLEEMSSSGTVLNTYTNSYVSCSSPAIDSEGNIWVPGYYTSQTLTEFAPSGTVLNSFSFASGANPESVVFDRNGNMWVTLSGAQEVEKLTPGGTVLATVPVDTRGSGLGPTGIAVDGANNLWVAGHRSGYVWEISSSGVVQGSWSDGGVANSLAIDPSGNVWVDNALAPSLTEIAGSNVGLPTPAMAKLDALNNNCENLAATALNAPPSLVNGILSYSSINVWNTSTDLDALYPAYPAACEGNN